MTKLESLTGVKGGSSGAFIYESHDSRFIIKTVSTEEKLVFLNKLLPHYVNRIYSNNSALARIWGVFQIQCVGNYSTNLILMDNVSSSFKQGQRKYDLKGSLYARKCYAKATRKTIVGKDCNFLEEIGKLGLQYDDAQNLLARLEQDVKMLASFNIMDYSLLVTEITCPIKTKANSLYMYRTNKGEKTYCTIALIDYFQEYTFAKKAERFWKTKIQRVHPNELSSMEAKKYAERFIGFVSSISS